jgi:hypothetical protein
MKRYLLGYTVRLGSDGTSNVCPVSVQIKSTRCKERVAAREREEMYMQ